MKRGKKMILLICLLGVLLIGYGAIGRIETAAPAGETEGSYPLWAQDAEVAALAWEQDGVTFAFTMGESVWTRDGDAAFPVNQSALDSLADKLENLTAVRELTNVTSRADYGLDAPSFTVTAKDAEGKTVVYSMGDTTPFEDGYYLGVSGSDAVYVIETALSDTFDKTLTQLATMEDIPQVGNATRLTVGDRLDISLDAGKNVWVDTATGEALDQGEAAALVTAAKGLAWSELIATSATEEELASWTLDEQATQVTLYNGEEAELAILLGGEDAEGDRYARLPDSGMVYTFYSSDADDLLAAGIDTLWNKQPVSMTADQLGEAVFSWDGGERTLTGADAEAAWAQGIMDQLSSLTGTQRVELGEMGETLLTVTLTDTEGSVQTLAFHAYDVDSYLLPVTDAHGMLVAAQDVDKLIRMLRQEG